MNKWVDCLICQTRFDGEDPPKEYSDHLKYCDKIKEEKYSRSISLNEILTLPVESGERKNYPMLSGCLNYFPAALAGVARISKIGNDKHNPGQQLHHNRSKSTDHGDCILRHLVDLQSLLVAIDRGQGSVEIIRQIRDEASSVAWRALALSQEIHEKLGSPLAPGAKNE